MEREIPNNISNRLNKAVLDFVRDSFAHSDLTEALMTAVEPLGDVQVFCPDPSEYRYVVVSTKGIILGFAIGMNTIAFRLNTLFKQRAVATGGNTIPELGDEWVSFIPSKDNWPKADLLFWAQKAYVYVRETKNV